MVGAALAPAIIGQLVCEDGVIRYWKGARRGTWLFEGRDHGRTSATRQNARNKAPRYRRTATKWTAMLFEPHLGFSMSSELTCQRPSRYSIRASPLPRLSPPTILTVGDSTNFFTVGLSNCAA